MNRKTDIDLTAIMEREGITNIRRTMGLVCVSLHDGRVGTGATVGAALDSAKASDDLTTFARKLAA